VNLLVDENLSPRVAELLTKAGHNAVHIRDLRATSAPDTAIMALAVAGDRVISADTDFGALLAQSRATEPSVILVRELLELRPPDLVNIIVANLDLLEPHLQAGAICAFTPAGIRVQALPLR
jgi:predicted nuclease of predicted toxin-antitoxin system